MKAIAHARPLTALLVAVLLAACQGNVPAPPAPAPEPPAAMPLAAPEPDVRDELDRMYVDTCLADGASLPQCRCEVEAYRRHGVADGELRALLVGLGVIERTGDAAPIPDFEAFNAAAEDCRAPG